MPRPGFCPEKDKGYSHLGGSAAEMISSTADWLLQMLEGKYKPDMDNRILVSRLGTYQEGTGRPRWWLA